MCVYKLMYASAHMAAHGFMLRMNLISTFTFNSSNYYYRKSLRISSLSMQDIY